VARPVDPEITFDQFVAHFAGRAIRLDGPDKVVFE
jgi:hypothetical protein